MKKILINEYSSFAMQYIDERGYDHIEYGLERCLLIHNKEGIKSTTWWVKESKTSLHRRIEWNDVCSVLSSKLGTAVTVFVDDS